MFVHEYYPSGHFPDQYFPSGNLSGPHFHHGYFPVDYFLDDYFPGDFVDVVIEPPIEPPPTVITVGGGGRPRPLRVHHPKPPVHAIQDVRAIWDLELPVPVVDVLGYVTDVIRGTQDILLSTPTVEAFGRMQPAGMVARWDVTISPLRLDVSASASAPPRNRRSDDDQREEDLLLEHYMLSLKDYQ